VSIRTFAVAVTLAALFAAPSWGMPSVTVTETFDGTIDQATWRMGTQDEILPAGGHPGAYLRVPQLDTAEPRISTVPSLAPQFLGDYRERGVIGLGIDVNLFDVGISAVGRPVSLFLHSNMGTPDDPLDDCEVVFVGPKNVPKPGAGWRPYEFKVPAWSRTLPQNWIVNGTCAGLSPDETWNRVISNVTEASFDLGEPGYFYYFQIWDLGFDNPRITLGKGGTGPTFVLIEPLD
jgi:hypothetical protein